MLNLTGLLIWLIPDLHREERGQGLAEYALILAFTAVAIIVALTGLGSAIVGILSQTANSL